MQYPHWLMIGGAVLVALGFIGFAFRQNKNVVEPDHDATEMKTKGNNQKGGHNDRIGLTPFKKRLAEPHSDDEREVLLKLLADEEAKEPPPKKGILKPR
jgi:hypothetical protein